TIPLRTEVEGSCEVLLRPEDLALCPPGERGDGCRPVSVELVEYYGHDTVYLVTLDDGTRVRVREVSVPRFERGDAATVRTNGQAAVAFAAG
ncbi:MAG TPA: TOBE domain-containing protein, partial [Acidimicrobiales bacterium]|nr:TOBE domain-containing protein [Acidimicrobiales bacterium]